MEEVGARRTGAMSGGGKGRTEIFAIYPRSVLRGENQDGVYGEEGHRGRHDCAFWRGSALERLWDRPGVLGNVNKVSSVCEYLPLSYRLNLRRESCARWKSFLIKVSCSQNREMCSGGLRRR